MSSKPAIPLLFFLTLTASLSAQTSIGVEGGLSYNSPSTNIANRPATDLSGRVGWGIAVPLRYRLYPWLYLLAAPGLVQKGYSMDRTDSLSGEYDRHINTYIQLPVGVGFNHDWGRLRAGVELGIDAGYWLYGHQKGYTADIFGNTGTNGSEQFPLIGFDGSYSFDPRRDRRLEVGWWVGPVLQYGVTGPWSLTAGAKYFGALTSQTRAPTSPIPFYNRTWVFSIGGAWSLSNLRSRRL